MIQLEGILLGFGSTLISTLFGCLLGWQAVTRISGRPFHFPVFEVIILICMTLIIQVIISTAAVRHVRHETLIEKIRYSG